MRTTDIPAKIPKAFALNGDKNTIPVSNSTEQENTGAASLDKGFPPVTMLARSAGGIPPDGRDFNGILYTLSDAVKWVSAGMSYPFDSAFASAIGGYPKGSIIPNSAGDGSWLNTIEQNSANPEASGAALTGWVPFAPRGATGISGLTGTSRALSTLEASRPRINFSGTLTSNIYITFPAWTMRWEVVNQCTGNYQVIVRSNTGNGVVVPQGLKTTIFCYGAELIKDQGDVSNFDVLPIGYGGTGAQTAADARTNIGLGNVGNFMAVQQGGVANQANNKVYIGWGNDGILRCTVDATDLGQIFTTKSPPTAKDTGALSLDGGTVNGVVECIGSAITRGAFLIRNSDGTQIASVSAKSDGSVTVWSDVNGHSFGLTSAGGFYTSAGTAIYEAGQRVYSPNNPPPITYTAVTGVRLSGRTVISDTGGRIDLPSGCVYTGMSGSNYNASIWAAYSAIQVNINGTWATVATV